ncbi:MAG TPA: winged helix DNA-binding domain-containing protein, partial [Lapillicoccus sp.]|nr:winged helix DNA-binding domain-containing protein [Lapillicoccus sp.]
TAKRVHQANAFMYRSLDLDAARLEGFVDVVRGLLAGGNHLTRKEIRGALPAGWVGDEGIHMAYLLMYAELEGVVCSGPRRGNQSTYALLDERAAPTPVLSDDEALTQFVSRYLRTRGPATVPDLTTWSGLTVTEVKRALTLLGDEVTTVESDGRAYLLVERAPPASVRSFLMPDYDEYGMAYKDRGAIAHPDHDYWTLPWNRAVVVDGVIAGAWQRTLRPDSVTVEVAMFDRSWDDPLVVGAAEEYSRFLGRGLDLRAATGL